MLKKVYARQSIKEVVSVDIKKTILDFFYPPVCGICGKLNQKFLCQKCNIILQGQAKFVIEKNQEIEKYFENHLYIFQYQGIIRKMILNYKFQEESFLYLTFVNFLLKNDFFFEILKTYDTIIPVPISCKRYKERGYNQSLLIAREIVNQINRKYKKQKIKLCLNCLYKTRDIMPQSTLKKQDRIQNVKGVYQLVNQKQLKGKKILLIDDIYTTGSTVKECAKIIQQAPIEKIDVLTIAKD